MGFYATFCSEKNRFLLIHDIAHGLYLVDLVSGAKFSVMRWREALMSQSQKVSAKKKKLRNSAFSDEKWSSSDDEPATKKELSVIENQAHELGEGKYWHYRFQNCHFCPIKSCPNPSGVTVFYHTRQMLVVFQNALQVISYESPDTVRLRKLEMRSHLPLDHFFSFGKVDSQVKLQRSAQFRDFFRRNAFE